MTQFYANDDSESPSPGESQVPAQDCVPIAPSLSSAQPSSAPGRTRQDQDNFELWNARAVSHLQSRFYDVPGFMKHRCSLTHIERAALGDVSGKSLLHLQCHFGQDTLSWAQLGANVVGVDYSPNAIAAARVLAKSMNLAAEFIESNVYDLPRHHHKQYDIVFTSYGVLKWLADIRGWAEVVAHFLAPGGLFYLVEFHPFLYVFDYDHATELTYPYFSDAAGTTYTEHGSYARPEMATTHTAHAWNHPTSEVITALLAAGLSIEEFREYPYSTLDCFPFVRMGGHERYVHQTHPEKVPMLYSVAARRPAEAPCSK